ncbi:hypothetical protein ACG83_25430 [Frankia sp. R43]|nr:hypothetical protein ACG83_25430 [Frankia sp. R43]
MTGARGTDRLARAAVFGVSSTCLALAAHVAAGDPRPPVVLLAVATALLIRVAFGFADRERALPALVAAVVTAQVLLHTAFALQAHHHQAAGAARPRPGAGAHLLAELVPAGPMIAAHALAAGCVAVSLRRCERRLWATAALRVAVERVVAVVAFVLMDVLARLRAAARLMASGAGTWARLRNAAAGMAAALGRVGGSGGGGGGRGIGGGGGGAGARWCAHLLLLGTDAGWRGPPARRPGSCPRAGVSAVMATAR